MRVRVRGLNHNGQLDKLWVRKQVPETVNTNLPLADVPVSVNPATERVKGIVCVQQFDPFPSDRFIN